MSGRSAAQQVPASVAPRWPVRSARYAALQDVLRLGLADSGPSMGM
ncbi:hypothetical protein [Nocardia sp. NPDC051981]